MGKNSNANNIQNPTMFGKSLISNNSTFLLYYNRLMSLAISRFKWKGLPDSVDKRFLELCLYYDGQAVYFNDDILGNLCLQVMTNGQLNVYRIPTKRTAYAVTGYQKYLDESNSVIIYNDVLRTNTMLAVQEYALRLYNLERTIDINVNAQKTPVLIIGTEDQKLTLANAYAKFEGNQPVIMSDRNVMDLQQCFKVLKTDAPFVADKLQTLKADIWNDALVYLGISTVNSDKKERLITSEVQQTSSPAIAQREVWLEMRETACKQINKMFGTKISVEFNDNLNVSFPLGGGSNGLVYDASKNNM